MADKDGAGVEKPVAMPPKLRLWRAYMRPGLRFVGFSGGIDSRRKK
jgi:hypothetical protein